MNLKEAAQFLVDQGYTFETLEQRELRAQTQEAIATVTMAGFQATQYGSYYFPTHVTPSSDVMEVFETLPKGTVRWVEAHHDAGKVFPDVISNSAANKSAGPRP